MAKVGTASVNFSLSKKSILVGEIFFQKNPKFKDENPSFDQEFRGKVKIFNTHDLTCQKFRDA